MADKVHGKVAAVTGAGSGIGRALAVGLASRGARLAISDVNTAGLDETVELVKQAGAEVTAMTVDVADREAVALWAEAVLEHYGVVHQIYNNAGITMLRSVQESSYDDYERIFNVNLWGVIYGTKAFLPHLIASGAGQVVNISSLNGFMAQPDMSHYCTSKFAVRGFTETLRLEMEAQGAPVRVTVVHPGGVSTAIADSALTGMENAGVAPSSEARRLTEKWNTNALTLDADAAAKIILDGVESGKSRVLVGRDAKAVDLMVRLLPSAYGHGVRLILRRLTR